MTGPVAEIVRLDAGTVAPLHALLDDVAATDVDGWFRPHPFTLDHLRTLCDAHIGDLHYVMTIEGRAIAYGMLRGWDEGYAVPSLGIAVHSSWRGHGLGLTMMHFLHGMARLRTCERVRLRVSRTNVVAIALYRGVGYRFDDAAPGDDALLTGYLDLTRR